MVDKKRMLRPWRDAFMKTLLTIIAVVTLAGCSATDVRQYSGYKPVFELYEYFQGETTGWGIVQDRKGVLLRQFVVKIHGSVSDKNELVLKENFKWSDGELQHRTWTIVAEDRHNFKGTASDVVGTASGEIYGNALNWKYYLDITVDDATYTVYLDDWMFLQPDNVIINRTKMSKFGFHLGDITIVFRKNVMPQEV